MGVVGVGEVVDVVGVVEVVEVVGEDISPGGMVEGEEHASASEYTGGTIARALRETIVCAAGAVMMACVVGAVTMADAADAVTTVGLCAVAVVGL